MTGFTREEEIDFATIDDTPFLLEESLSRNAARFSKVQPWGALLLKVAALSVGKIQPVLMPLLIAFAAVH